MGANRANKFEIPEPPGAPDGTTTPVVVLVNETLANLPAEGARPRRPGRARAAERNVATLAFALAAVGTYGVLSSLVTERVREIGSRMALGANRTNVLSTVPRQGLSTNLIGVVIGIAGGWADVTGDVAAI